MTSELRTYLIVQLKRRVLVKKSPPIPLGRKGKFCVFLASPDVIKGQSKEDNRIAAKDILRVHDVAAANSARDQFTKLSGAATVILRRTSWKVIPRVSLAPKLSNRCRPRQP